MRSLFLIITSVTLLIGGAAYVYFQQDGFTDTNPNTGLSPSLTEDIGNQFIGRSAKNNSLNVINTLFPYIKEPEVNGNVYTYRDVLLDEEGFSKIIRLDVELSKKQINAITIDGLQLTGEINEDGKFNVIGLKDKNTVISALLSDIPKITIQNSTLSILTKQIGGLSFDYDLIGQHTEGNDMALQGTVESRQKNLKFVSSIEGLIDSTGKWQINAALEQGSIDLTTIRVSRGNGKFSFKGDAAPDSKIEIAGSYGLGGLSLYRFPWQNTTGTLRGTSDTPIFNMHATALGQENIDMDMIIDTTGNDLTIGGDIRTMRMTNLLEFIERHNGLETKDDPLHALQDTANISLDFGVEGIQSALRDRIVYRVDKPFEGKGMFLLNLPE